jgi:hypothetical protein
MDVKMISRLQGRMADLAAMRENPTRTFVDD